MLTYNPNELPAVQVDRFQSSVENGQAVLALGHAVTGAENAFVFHARVAMSLDNMKALGLLAIETCLKAAMAAQAPGVTVTVEGPAPAPVDPVQPEQLS